MNLDTELVGQVAEILGTQTATATVHAALREVLILDLRRKLAAEDMPDLTPEAVEEMRRPRQL